MGVLASKPNCFQNLWFRRLRGHGSKHQASCMLLQIGSMISNTRFSTHALGSMFCACIWKHREERELCQMVHFRIHRRQDSLITTNGRWKGIGTRCKTQTKRRKPVSITQGLTGRTFNMTTFSQTFQEKGLIPRNGLICSWSLGLSDTFPPPVRTSELAYALKADAEAA